MTQDDHIPLSQKYGAQETHNQHTRMNDLIIALIAVTIGVTAACFALLPTQEDDDKF